MSFTTMKLIISFLFIFSVYINATAQDFEHEQTDEQKDSTYIDEVEDKYPIDKVLHAEPLFIDLIRDLGARKGEKEWNIGLGLTDRTQYDEYTALIEYEWAPIDRLGLEIELPFSLYYPTMDNADAPSSRLNSLKLAGQYSFYVSEKHSTSMALGYIHEFQLPDFNQYGNSGLIKGNVFNPFFVAAKRWGNTFHTLLYTGPVIKKPFDQSIDSRLSYQINTSLHYMISGTRNFIGLETNSTIENNIFDFIFRPQMRLQVTDNLMVGIVGGIPINRSNERISTFLRLIYEPVH
jgi:hypothetical protein